MSDIYNDIVDAAGEVHSILGPGHTENIYHRALERELSERGIGFSSEGTIPIFYKGAPVGRRRPDMFVKSEGGTIVVELKAGKDSGSEQLDGYISILEDDNNFEIVGSVLIQFNEDLEFDKAEYL